jgi:basic membrane protein A
MRRKLVGALVLTLCLIATACSSGNDGGGGGGSTNGEAAGAGLKIGFIYDGDLEDGGWNSSHKAASDYVAQKLPGAEIQNIANVAPGDEAQSTASDLASQGYDLIIGTTYYQPDFLKIAGQFPDTKFVAWGGFKTAANVGEYSLATEDGRYLDGILAGSMTKSNVIGYPAGFDIPEVVRGIDAFTLGAQSVNPNVVVKPIMVNSWYDPPKEQQAATSAVNDGADVLAMETNSPAVASVAEKNDAWMIGYGWDQESRSPNTWLGSFTFDWGPYYLAQAQAIMGGTWKPEIYYGGMADGVIGLSPFGSNVPQDVQDLVNQKAQDIRDGTLDVLAGPIVDNQGNMQVAAGSTIAKADRTNCCDYYVEGVDSQPPSGSS